MMKKSKFIFGVATVLSLGIVATTVATYVSRPDDKVVNIGGTTSTNGSLTLTLVNNKDSSSSNPTIFEQVGDSVPSTVSAENLTKTINPYNKLHARYALGVSELVDYKEPVIYGQITLTVTTTFNWDDIELKAIVDGYSTDVKTDDENPFPVLWNKVLPIENRIENFIIQFFERTLNHLPCIAFIMTLEVFDILKHESLRSLLF